MPFQELPTAAQALPRQSTPASELILADAGLAVGSIVHALPSQRMASTKLGLLYELADQVPTARQAVGRKHETPPNSLNMAPRGLGVAC